MKLYSPLKKLDLALNGYNFERPSSILSLAELHMCTISTFQDWMHLPWLEVDPAVAISSVILKCAGCHPPHMEQALMLQQHVLWIILPSSLTYLLLSMLWQRLFSRRNFSMLLEGKLILTLKQVRKKICTFKINGWVPVDLQFLCPYLCSSLLGYLWKWIYIAQVEMHILKFWVKIYSPPMSREN